MMFYCVARVEGEGEPPARVARWGWLAGSRFRGTTSSGTQRVQAAFILVSTCGMGAFFMQTIAVFSTFSLSWPEELAWLFEISAIFMSRRGG